MQRQGAQSPLSRSPDLIIALLSSVVPHLRCGEGSWRNVQKRDKNKAGGVTWWGLAALAGDYFGCKYQTDLRKMVESEKANRL